MSVPANNSSKLHHLRKWAFDPHGKGPDTLRILLVVNPVLIFPLVVISNGFGPHFLKSYLFSVLIGECVSLTCIAATRLLRLISAKFLKIELRRQTYLYASLAGMMPGMAIGFFVAAQVAKALEVPWSAPTFPDYGLGFMMGSLIFGVIILLDLWNTAQSRAREFEYESAQAKLSAINAQLNPHLLFNALNTIASLIQTDPAAAEETTIRLSELYRGILASAKRATQPLSTELDICRAYLGIEAARFGERLRWSIEAEPALSTFEIPSLLIQPIVENAVKHGLASRASGGRVEVRIKKDGDTVEILVEDDGVGLGNSVARKGTETGVSATRARLALLYAGTANFEIGARRNEQGTRVKMRIPGASQ